MSDTHAPDRTRPRPAGAHAEVRRSRWPGWIWAIPIAAVLLVGWWVVRNVFSGGETITITFDDVHGLQTSNTKVVYRGMQVGQVTGLELAKDGNSVTVTAQIKDAAQPLLRKGTRFWLRGAEPDLSDPSSLSAILSGPTLVMDPGPGDKTDRFSGLVRRPVAPAGTAGEPQTYALSLSGAIGGLARGEPVKLRGFTVGEIKDVGFRYDAHKERIDTPVTIALYPSLFHIGGPDAPHRADALKTEIEALIHRGLKARLERDPPVVGSPEVTLDMVPGDAGAPAVEVAGLPQIPAASGGDLSSIVDRVNKVPVDQIANNLLDITHHVDAIVASQALTDAIAQLDGALTQIRQTADRAGPQVADMVDRMRKAADQIDRVAALAQQTAEQANKVLGATPNQNDAQTAMREITEAARSVRELANYLDQHPEALVQGKSGK